MKKSVSALLACILFILQLSLISCEKAIPPEQNFSFSITDPKIEICVGEPITFRAELSNRTGNRYTLAHGMPMISIYTHPAEEECPMIAIGSTLCHSKFTAHGTLNQEYTTQFEEPGTYILGALCVFDIHNTQFRYEDTMTIIVTPKQ